MQAQRGESLSATPAGARKGQIFARLKARNPVFRSANQPDQTVNANLSPECISREMSKGTILLKSMLWKSICWWLEGKESYFFYFLNF